MRHIYILPDIQLCVPLSAPCSVVSRGRSILTFAFRSATFVTYDLGMAGEVPAYLTPAGGRLLGHRAEAGDTEFTCLILICSRLRIVEIGTMRNTGYSLHELIPAARQSVDSPMAD